MAYSEHMQDNMTGLLHQGGIQAHRHDSVTESSAVAWNMQFLSPALIHRHQRIFPSLHLFCLTGVTKLLWALPIPPPLQMRAASSPL